MTEQPEQQDQLEPRSPGSRLVAGADITLRVYRVGADGSRTELGVQEVTVDLDRVDTHPKALDFPPCRCPQHQPAEGAR